MNIQCTTDPISWNEVTNLDTAPGVYEGDGENEDDRKEYLSLGQDHRIVFQGNDSYDYVAEG